MKTRAAVSMLSTALVLFGVASGQSSEPAQSTAVQQPAPRKHGRSAGGEIGSGTGDIGKGAAKGVGAAAVGVGKGAADLATLHPLNAAGDVAKGGVIAGKDVAVGSVKGTGKVLKGVGKVIAKPF